MDIHSHSEHLCYVRCNFCNTVLAVGVPCKRSVDTVTVKCGYCNCLSFLSTRPVGQVHHQSTALEQQSMSPNTSGTFQHPPPPQGYFEHRKGGQTSSMSSSSLTFDQQPSSNAPYVVKPPERKHRLPSAYNRFMKEEIQRIKTANPEIPHREAFSSAAKNWARYVPHSSGSSAASSSNTNERINAFGMGSLGDNNHP
ncbi:hypothetical protein C5167_005756 [Papaver somniferum]|uniref:Uncharacterized protein n=1 Tax=Papaver somniferum TaxID=3469 RepID=A0A4Y7JCB3_PAPSO|nr:protein CRABS CLAW-like [Papaver somniferum]RZC58457.1 hypothetical protein C5167_005756 [Papaver somniferum]